MTEKRFKYYEEPNGEFPFPYIKNTDGKIIISLYECYDLLNEQHKENITLINKLNNFKLHSKDLERENQLLKKALRELLENDGNAYMIDLMDKIFDLNYREWYNPTGHNSEDYVDWEEELQLKELRDLYD